MDWREFVEVYVNRTGDSIVRSGYVARRSVLHGRCRLHNKYERICM